MPQRQSAGRACEQLRRVRPTSAAENRSGCVSVRSTEIQVRKRARTRGAADRSDEQVSSTLV
jgi:hypothetical protein